MISKGLFKEFTTAVESFDFSLKKYKKHNYVLEVTAETKDAIVGDKAIILGTDDIEIAVSRSLEVINDFAREIAPGIKVKGEIAGKTPVTLKESIKLVPYDERLVAPGIRTVEEDDFDYYCECDDCEDNYDCDDYDYYEEDDSEDIDHAIDMLQQGVNLIARILQD